MVYDERFAGALGVRPAELACVRSGGASRRLSPSSDAEDDDGDCCAEGDRHRDDGRPEQRFHHQVIFGGDGLNRCRRVRLGKRRIWPAVLGQRVGLCEVIIVFYKFDIQNQA